MLIMKKGKRQKPTSTSTKIMVTFCLSTLVVLTIIAIAKNFSDNENNLIDQTISNVTLDRGNFSSNISYSKSFGGSRNSKNGFNGKRLNYVSSIEKTSEVVRLNLNEDSINTTEEITDTKEYDENTDYIQLINDCLNDPLNNSFDQAKEYERLRNQKVRDLYPSIYTETNYFTNYNSWNELFQSNTMDSYFIEKDIKYIVTSSDGLNLRIGPNTSYEKIRLFSKNTIVTFLGIITNEENEIWYKVLYENTIGYLHSEYVSIFDSSYNMGNYTEEDVYWLAVALTEEAGCKWFPEWVRNYVGCVVLNRVDSPNYPNTIYEVLYDEGQYAFAARSTHKEPYEWCIETATDLLNGNRMLPSDIVYQANFRQGSYTYDEYYDEVLGTTLYFCGR